MLTKFFAGLRRAAASRSPSTVPLARTVMAAAALACAGNIAPAAEMQGNMGGPPGLELLNGVIVPARPRPAQASPDDTIAHPAAQSPALDEALPAKTAAPADQPAQAAAPQPAAPDARASLPPSPEFAKLNKPLADWKTELDGLDERLKQRGLTREALGDIRARIETIRANAMAYANKLGPDLSEAQAQLSRLGEPPKDGATPESAAVAESRAQLARKVSEISGAIKTEGVLDVRAGQMIEQVQTHLRARFSSELFERQPSPMTSELWVQIFQAAGAAWSSSAQLTDDWYATLKSPRPIIVALTAALALLLATYIASKILVRRLRYNAEPGEIPLFHRTGSAIWVTLIRALPAIVFVCTYFGLLYAQGALTDKLKPLVAMNAIVISAVAMVIALATTILAPRRPQWRLLPASDHAARRLSRLTAACAVVYGFDILLARMNDVVYAPVALTVAQSFVASIAFALLLAAILRTKLGPSDEHAGLPSVRWLSFLKVPLWGVVFAVLIGACLGYIAFARFLASQIVVTGSIMVIVYLGHIAIDEFANSLPDTSTPTGKWLNQKLGITSTRAEHISLTVLILLNLALISVALPLLLLQWGFSPDDVRAWLTAAYFGFSLGNLRISLAAILVAIAVFILVVTIVRLLAMWLDTRIFARARMDRGLRDSTRTMLGYVGVILGFLLALSYVGADLSDLAIVAGALSVGIGFGLQNIVNNFVSGIILLAERPIKVGDWIVVGQEEGFVRRINVRATEIETFERAHVVVPNSSLIGEPVKNWMLRGPMGRIEILIGVSYSSDPQQVHDLLLAAAKGHSEVLDAPAPSVLFMDFGQSSLDFSLRAFVRSIDRSLGVRSDLRFAIHKALKDADIQIPFPQRELHIREVRSEFASHDPVPLHGTAVESSSA